MYADVCGSVRDAFYVAVFEEMAHQIKIKISLTHLKGVLNCMSISQ